MLLHHMVAFLSRLAAVWQSAQNEEKAQGLVEYALVIMFVAIAVIVILALMGPTIGNVFSNVVNQL